MTQLGKPAVGLREGPDREDVCNFKPRTFPTGATKGRLGWSPANGERPSPVTAWGSNRPVFRSPNMLCTDKYPGALIGQIKWAVAPHGHGSYVMEFLGMDTVRRTN